MRAKVGIEVGLGEGGLTDIETGIISRHLRCRTPKDDDFSTGLKNAYSALVNEVYIEYGIEPEEGYTPAGEIGGRDADEHDTEEFFEFIPVIVMLYYPLFLYSPPAGEAARPSSSLEAEADLAAGTSAGGGGFSWRRELPRRRGRQLRWRGRLARVLT